MALAQNHPGPEASNHPHLQGLVLGDRNVWNKGWWLHHCKYHKPLVFYTLKGWVTCYMNTNAHAGGCPGARVDGRFWTWGLCPQACSMSANLKNEQGSREL